MKKHLKLWKSWHKNKSTLLNIDLILEEWKWVTTVEPTVEWSQDQMVEVLLNEPDDFLKVRETLTRIGVASRQREETLSVLPHLCTSRADILSFILRNCLPWMASTPILTVNDVQRRNRIATLACWLGTHHNVVSPDCCVWILLLWIRSRFWHIRDKSEWVLEQKYNIGSKKKESC